MTQLKSYLLLTLFIFLFTNIYSQNTTSDAGNNKNIIHGKKYIFTINTPANWVNDKELARNFGLKCFFYPESDTVDQLQTYIYALGIDKITAEETLDTFLSKDLEKFTMKHPDANYKTTPVEKKGEIINSILYSYSNLEDRFQEEVLYCEVDSAYIILTFSAIDSLDYIKQLPAFNNFVNSFEYKGNNPESYFDFLKSKQQK